MLWSRCAGLLTCSNAACNALLLSSHVYVLSLATTPWPCASINRWNAINFFKSSSRKPMVVLRMLPIRRRHVIMMSFRLLLYKIEEVYYFKFQIQDLGWNLFWNAKYKRDLKLWRSVLWKPWKERHIGSKTKSDFTMGNSDTEFSESGAKKYVKYCTWGLWTAETGFRRNAGFVHCVFYTNVTKMALES